MIAALTSPQPALEPQTMLPDLLAAYPHARLVFDRYGLRGCGGPLGPVESIRFFAHSHGIDETRLLAELRAAIDSPEQAPESAEPSIADSIYRRFFTGGILIVLTAGATWGAWLLWRIAFAHSFTGISILDINAHGHAQIYGWLGLFIMGFAYQAFPRLWHTDLVAPPLAVGTFAAMLIGIIVRTIGMTMAASGNWALFAALAGGALETAAIFTFIAQILLTFRRGDSHLEPYVAFAISALAWLALMTVMSVWHTWNTMTATSTASLIWVVGTYQGPLRDMQIHGVAMLMILGVCMRMLPAIYGVPPTPQHRAWRALGILNLAVILEIVLYIGYRWTGSHILAATVLLAWLMLIAGAAMVVLPWKLWHKFPETDRSAKFIRTGYLWLAISLAMLLLFPAYQAVSHKPFSHAYYGAIRHAITVGFISLMIMGFAARVVPTLNGLDTRKLTALWGPFILINTGCFLRVSLQTLTDFYPDSFSVVGISGVLEVTALAWWGIGLMRIMQSGKRQLQQEQKPTPAQITSEHFVADILEWFPQTGDVFDRYGFWMLKNPVMRRTMARGVSVAQAARMHKIETSEFVDSLNAAIACR